MCVAAVYPGNFRDTLTSRLFNLGFYKVSEGPEILASPPTKHRLSAAHSHFGVDRFPVGVYRFTC